MSETSERALPDLFECMLDREGLLRLATDIGTCAELLGVTLKHSGRGHADDAPVSLQHAVEQVIAATALGLQVRYRHQGRQWWDTVLRTPQGFRLVRVDHGQTLEGP